MKISKLFHWLYALLILLPFTFFVPSVLYYAFNDNATMQTVEVPDTETISVDFNQNIDFNNYSYDLPGFVGTNEVLGQYITLDGTITSGGNYFLNYWLSDSNLVHFDANDKFILRGIDSFSGFNVLMYNGSNVESLNSFATNVMTASFSGDFAIYFNRGTAGAVTLYGEPQLFNLTKMFGSGNEPTLEEFNNYFPNSYYPYTESELMQITYGTGETEQLVENTSVINYAWESIWDLPLFNWCKVSFVSVPFTYITGLFGLAASNSFNYVFTYFASMSIIWLVFDVIMYVPLLVHRWLDKGIVE